MNDSHDLELIRRFALSQGCNMLIGKTPDDWNYEIRIYKISHSTYVKLYTGYGFTKKEAYSDLLNFIMLCNNWQSKDEMKIWLDLNERLHQ